MRRFVYAPDVNAYVVTQDGTTLELTDDIISGNVTLRVGAMSNASLVLQNNNRKYLQRHSRIHPMDRIVIYLTRIHKPILVFSGYIDRAPWEQPYPGPVQITASCTLKRLMHTYWDPGLPFVQKYLAQFDWSYDPTTGNMIDPNHSLFNLDFNGGLGNILRAVMHDVGGWPIGYKIAPDNGKNTVHVQKLPDSFLKVTKKLLAAQVVQDVQNQAVINRVVDSLYTSKGVYTGTSGTSADSIQMVDNVEDISPLSKAAANKTYLATIYGERFTGNSLTTATELDLYLASKSSPLAGQGQALVNAGNKYGFDARLLVAIAGAESSLVTLSAPFNMFGYGVNLAFTSWTEAINTISSDLSKNYFSEGRTTISTIQPKWAPGSAANDPHHLNLNWVKNASDYYTDLGGNPEQDVRLITQRSTGQYKPQGSIGDVKVSDPTFFSAHKILSSSEYGPPSPITDPTDAELAKAVGHSFRIKGNPYGDNTYVFHAIYDQKIPQGQISIYVPGATGKGTPWAQEWKDKKVTLETSFGREPYPSSGATNPDKHTDIPGVYINPFIKCMDGLVPERTDQGIDYNHSGTGEIVAIGNGTVMGIIDNWYLDQPYFWYSLDDGDHQGEYVFIAECIDILVQKGDQVTAGQTIARFNPAKGGNGIEIGFAQANGNVLTPAAGHDHANTPGGLRFARFMKSIGAPVRDDPGPGEGASGSATGIGSGSTATGTYGVTGVQITEANISSIAGATAAGFQLGFPAVSDFTLAVALTGERALSNAVPLFEWIQFICTASGRQFQSMPNGDFLAFYPDYFNWSGQTPYFVIDPIETVNLTVDIGDTELTTHVFTTGDINFSGEIDLSDKLASTVASVKDIAQFLSIGHKGSPAFDPITFLQRYGPRPLSEDRPEIKNSLLQFMYGWMVFLEKWAKQFYCDAEFTFMPELRPGGLIEFNGFELQFYVEEVSHDFDRAGGFSTSASLIAPSSKSKTANPSMVLAEGLIN